MRHIHTTRVTTVGPSTFRPSTRAPTTASGKPVKSKAPKPPAHPIFEEAAKCTTDPQWRMILLDCSRNKFPAKFGFRGSTLSFRRKTKSITTILPSDPAEALIRIAEFFKANGGIMTEMENEQIRFSKRQETIIEWTSWKEVPSKEKRSMVCKYAYEISYMCNLNRQQTNDLEKTIYNGLLIGGIKPEDIIISGMKIIAINSLYWDSNLKRFTFSPEHEKKSRTKRIVIDWTVDVEPRKTSSLAQEWYSRQIPPDSSITSFTNILPETFAPIKEDTTMESVTIEL